MQDHYNKCTRYTIIAKCRKYTYFKLTNIYIYIFSSKDYNWVGGPILEKAMLSLGLDRNETIISELKNWKT